MKSWSGQFPIQSEIATRDKSRDTTREWPLFDRRPSASAIQHQIKRPRGWVQPRLDWPDITSGLAPRNSGPTLTPWNRHHLISSAQEFRFDPDSSALTSP